MIYAEALDLIAGTPDDTPKSELWADTTRGLISARATFKDEFAFIDWLTSIDNFCMPHHGPDREIIVDRWLAVMPEVAVEESLLASAAGIVWRDSQRLSTQQMLHSYYAKQIDTIKPMRILEIGAGFGGLARILNTTMQRQYTILDLPSSLFCSFVYLKTHFPRAIHVWAKDAADLDAPADFRYVPAHLAEDLKSHRFDMAVNTCSLGEMLPETVNGYVDLIANTCKYFYSHNRVGSVPIGEAFGWDKLIDVTGGDGQIDPAMPPSHEILVRRCER